MCVVSRKVPIRKKYGNLFNDPRKLCYIYILKKLKAAVFKCFSCLIIWLKIINNFCPGVELYSNQNNLHDKVNKRGLRKSPSEDDMKPKTRVKHKNMK